MIHVISYKTLIDLIYGFIRIYDGTRYLTLFRSEKLDAIFNRIRYLTTELDTFPKLALHIFFFFFFFAKIKVDSYES